jgi:Mg/Co/Ni transporter MgtE
MDQEQNVELVDDVAEGHDMKNAEDQSVAATATAAGSTSQAPARKGDKKNSDPMPKTKAGMINAMYGKLNSMKKADLQASYGSMMGEEIEVAEEEVVAEADTSFGEDLDALVESEATLSEEFKQKTAIIFEAALNSKIAEEVERIESNYEERLAEETQAQRDELVEKVDSYLNYVVENWMQENQVAIQNGLRAEIAENFMESLKGLFTESYIEVPESKVDLVDDLADQVEELEEALNKTTTDAIAMSEAIELLQREAIVTEAVADLAETQKEKFKKLAESVDFEDAEVFASKVATIKESFFSETTEAPVEEITEDVAPEAAVEVAPSMEKYLTAIRNSNR